jgi:hypothetical protein
LGLLEIGFSVDKSDKYIFNNFLIKRTDSAFHFYEIVSDNQMLISDTLKMNYNILNDERIVKLLNVFYLNSDNIIKDIKTYIRKNKIYKLIDDKKVPRCPRCGHNFYRGGYGICHWCIKEIERDGY